MMYKFYLFCIFISFVTFHLVSSTTSQFPLENYSTYNSACNLTFTCDPAKLLTCISGTCQCESPSNQIFSEIHNICQSTIGGECTTSHPPGSTGYRPCIDNAECHVILTDSGNTSHRECQCKAQFIENASGVCVPGIGQPCNYSLDDCNPLGMLVCKNGQCQCFDNLQIYDKDTNRCVSPAGTHCKLDSLQMGCVKNAICYPFYYWAPPKCLCKPGFTQAPNRTCIEVMQKK